MDLTDHARCTAPTSQTVTPVWRRDTGRPHAAGNPVPAGSPVGRLPHSRRHDDTAPHPTVCRAASNGSTSTASTQWQRDGSGISDNEMHLLIDVSRSPVLVHVSGILDARTGWNLDAVIREVISEGNLRFDLDIDRLDIVDPNGFDALSAVRRSIISAGGTVTRVHDGPQSPAQPPSPSFVPPDGAALRPLRAARGRPGTIVGAGG